MKALNAGLGLAVKSGINCSSLCSDDVLDKVATCAGLGQLAIDISNRANYLKELGREQQPQD